MLESIQATFWLAFWIGIISAISLPLGALTIRFWQPSSRIIALLMAFGAGALLFALTVDLFAPAIANALYWQVSLGAVIGSLVYLYLNQHLNSWGGFLRKTGTTLQFMQQKQKRQKLAFLTSINRLSFLKKLPEEDKQKLLSFIEIEEFSAKTVLYQQGDLHDAFYLIHSGTVRLQDPQRQLKTFIELEASDVFGRMAFFTRMPNATQAVVGENAEVWKISREAFNQFLESSPAALKAFREYYQEPQPDYIDALPQATDCNSEMMHYLCQRHNMSIDVADHHLNKVQNHIQQYHQLGRIVRKGPTNTLNVEFFQSALLKSESESQLFTLFEELSPKEKQAIVSQFDYRLRKQGECLYKNHSMGDYWFLLDYGEVELFFPQEKLAEPAYLGSGRFFSSRAFLLGGIRLSTAIAKTDVGYWQISRDDFECLMVQYPKISEGLKRYLQAQEVRDYLLKDKKVSEIEATHWHKQAVKSLEAQKLPDLMGLNAPPKHHVAPYLAIWLGIFLDGIPESLTIGAHITSHGVLSLSLIAGLFLSNYPEALSSSASMRAQGYSHRRIFIAWFSLTLLTGLGAAFGSVFFSGSSESDIAIVSGIAAGAMLTVIAETMLPESFAKAGSIVGFVTLLGFLTALMFKAINP